MSSTHRDRKSECLSRVRFVRLSHPPLPAAYQTADRRYPSTFIPFLFDFRDRVPWMRGVEPENLNRVDAAHLHFQASADFAEFQMLVTGFNRRDDAQRNFGDMLGVARGLDGGNRARNHRRVPPVEFRPAQESFDVRHVDACVRVRSPTVAVRSGTPTVMEGIPPQGVSQGLQFTTTGFTQNRN